jgi:hypothetical protein
MELTKSTLKELESNKIAILKGNKKIWVQTAIPETPEEFAKELELEKIFNKRL